MLRGRRRERLHGLERLAHFVGALNERGGISNATDDDTALVSTAPRRYMRSTCFSTNGAEEHV